MLQNLKMIESFIKKFANVKLRYKKIENKYYLISKELWALTEKINLNFFTIGVYLGHEKNEKFFPSLALLNILAKHTDDKIMLKDIGEMDFLYKKDLRSRHIKQYNGESKVGFLRLVVNEKNECLGYAKIVKTLDSPGIVLKNKLDMGDYLRREISQKV